MRVVVPDLTLDRIFFSGFRFVIERSLLFSSFSLSLTYD